MKNFRCNPLGRSVLLVLALVGFSTHAEAADLPTTDWREYAVIAEDRLYVGPNRNLRGNLVTTARGSLLDIGPDSRQIGSSSSFVAGWEVRLRSRASVANLYADRTSGVNADDGVRGQRETTSFPAPVALPTRQLPAGCVDTAPNLSIPGGATVTLNPGCHKTVTVRDGASLRLAAGEYDFRSLTIGKGSTLEAMGPVTVRIQRALRIQVEALLQPASGNPDDLVFHAAAIGNSSVIGRKTRFVGRLLAPTDGSVRIEQFTEITGTVVGRNVDMIGFHGERPEEDPYCGDGILDDGELCDLGDLNGIQLGPNGLASCRTDCTFCGDGIQQAGTTPEEFCDLGSLNGAPDSECSATCEREAYEYYCGDGILQDGEACDLGDQNGIARGANGLLACRVDCTYCGDGETQSSSSEIEVCDRGDLNGTPGIDCNAVCQAEVVFGSGECRVAPENIFKNIEGLAHGPYAWTTGSPDPAVARRVFAGPILNIGGEGQVALGPWYDVRPDDEGPKIVNLQIRNANTADDTLPECTVSDFMRGVDGVLCYNPDGGMLARVRFREARTATQSMSFAVALGCGEVWAGTVRLGDNALPEIRSVHPVLVDARDGYWITSDDLRTARSFEQEVPGDPLDWQRGSFEIIGVESIPCRPAEDEIRLAGNRWLRSIGVSRGEPTNHLTAKVFLVSPAAGVSYSYDTPAISRFAAFGSGALEVDGGLLENPAAPTLANCRAFDPQTGQLLDEAECVSAVNLALATSRAFGQFDSAPSIGAETRMVLSMPTRHLNCAEGDPYGTGPFSCEPEGEAAQCLLQVRDSLGPAQAANLAAPGQPASDGGCSLPLTTTEIVVRRESEGRKGDLPLWLRAPRPGFDGRLSRNAGTVRIYLDRNATGEILHSEEPESAVLNVFGDPQAGYEGLPLVGITIQKYQNGRIGGTFGNTSPIGTFQKLTPPENP